MTMLALPFDLRAYAAAQDTPNEGSACHPHRHVQADRPSRGVVIPQDVVAGVQQREETAFRELVRLIYVPLVQFATTIVGSRAESEDVVQDVFTMLWNLGHRWNPTGDPAAYLFASTRNIALNAVRKRERVALRERRAIVEGTSELRQADGDSPLATVIDAEEGDRERRLLLEILDSLSERQRSAYDLRYRRGLKVAAIAEVLGIAPKSAEQLVSRVTRVVIERLRARVAL